MFGDLKEQIQQAQKEMKDRLEQEEVSGTSAEGKVEVKVNGNRKLLSLQLDDEFYAGSGPREMENKIKEALNDALSKAEGIAEEEMKNSAKGMLPNIPGLF
jgi:hypothetical protein